MNLFYGLTKVTQKQTQSIPLVKDITSSILNTKTYELNLLNDKLVFDFFEIRQEQNKTSLTKSVFALILIKFHTLSKIMKMEKSFGKILRIIFSLNMRYYN